MCYWPQRIRQVNASMCVSACVVAAESSADNRGRRSQLWSRMTAEWLQNDCRTTAEFQMARFDMTFMAYPSCTSLRSSYTLFEDFKTQALRSALPSVAMILNWEFALNFAAHLTGRGPFSAEVRQGIGVCPAQSDPSGWPFKLWLS